MGNVVLGPNIKKESVRIDADQNILDPKTKQIVKPAEQEYQIPVPSPKTPEETKEFFDDSQSSPTIKLDTLSDIQAAIKKVEAQLEELKQLKKQKVEDMKKQLEEAEIE